MTYYRAYPIGYNNQIVGAPEVIEANCAADALVQAEGLPRNYSYELWERSLPVGFIRNQPVSGRATHA